MSETLTTLREDMKAAMRAGEKKKLEVVRMLIAEVQQGELSNQKPDKVVAGYHKKLKKARDEYDKLGEANRVAALDEELEILAKYVPDAPDAAATGRIVDDYLAANPDLGPGDVGRAMGGLMKQAKGQIDAGEANKLLREKLASRG